MAPRFKYDDAYTQYSVDFNQLNDGRDYHMPINNPDLAIDMTEKMVKGKGVMDQYKI